MPPGGLDVYLFPSVVGGGLGDIAEVRDAGLRLVRRGYPVHLYRTAGHALPEPVRRLLEGTPFRPVGSLAPRGPKALTVSAMWGVSAAPGRPGALGRPGPWAAEAERIERSYGSDRVVHVSLEEFARTLTSREETIERYREGGRPWREIRSVVRGARGRSEARAFHRAYRRFRAFDRPNVVHLYATFRPSPGFAREYPEAIQTGPLWPERSFIPPGPAAGAARRWLWYASPASSIRIADEVLAGLAGTAPRIALEVRSPRPETWAGRPVDRSGRVEPTDRWRRRCARAELRIATGSRTLLESLADGRPFLYYNGTIGAGRSARRHRPEKIRGLLADWRLGGIGRRRWADLDAFSRGRRVRSIVARLAASPGGPSGFPRAYRPSGFRPGFDDAGRYLDRLARRWRATRLGSGAFVAALRSEAGRALAGGPAGGA